MSEKPSLLATTLQELLLQANGQPLKVKKVIEILGNESQALLIVFLSLPFCLPIQIPGFSTPFGLVLALLGFSIACRRPLFLPHFLLDKSLSWDVLQKMVSWALKVNHHLNRFTYARMSWLLQNPRIKQCHGILIALLGFFLALPLPIPFTNLFSAIPLLLIGIAFLENDGLLLLIAYGIAAFGLLFFVWLFLLGVRMIH